MSSISQVIILHISDLHFGAEDENKLKAVLNIASEQKPDIICATGDIANYPRPKFFKNAKRFFRNRLMPQCDYGTHLFVVRGNHDAFFGAFGLWLYKKYLEEQTTFHQFLSIKNRDMCVFGIDSTAPSLKSLYNVGSFSEKSAQQFEKGVAELENSKGTDRFKKAFKIVLLHHHPLPTLTSRTEGMLYLKNSGRFLNMMANHGVNLILHGHQHDPCYFSLDYNRSGREESIMVLSAGTATKSDNAPTNSSAVDPDLPQFSAESQLYIIKINNSGVEVDYFNYEKTRKAYYKTKTFTKHSYSDPIASIDELWKYTVKSNGDLVGYGQKTLRAKSNKEGIADLKITIGIDPNSPPVPDTNNISFKVYRNDQELPNSRYVLVKDEPHVKYFNVILDPPIGLSPETVSWKYVWPEGWINLVSNGKDSGFYSMTNRVDSFGIDIRVEEPRSIKDFKIFYAEPSKITNLFPGNTQTRAFKIEQPLRDAWVWFDIFLNP